MTGRETETETEIEIGTEAEIETEIETELGTETEIETETETEKETEIEIDTGTERVLEAVQVVIDISIAAAAGRGTVMERETGVSKPQTAMKALRDVVLCASLTTKQLSMSFSLCQIYAI